MSFTAFGPIYRAACSLLPSALDTPNAKAMAIAAALQETRFDARRQIGGPAHGFWQFELGGVRGVLNHRASQPIIRSVLDRLDYDYAPETSYTAIEHNDVLAFAYARLLLYTLPQPLPERTDPAEGWRQYYDAWRPGKPYPEKWPANYAQAWQFIKEA